MYFLFLETVFTLLKWLHSILLHDYFYCIIYCTNREHCIEHSFYKIFTPIKGAYHGRDRKSWSQIS